jgi:hypothetical protein
MVAVITAIQGASCPISQGAMSLSVDLVRAAAGKAKLPVKGVSGWDIQLVPNDNELSK